MTEFFAALTEAERLELLHKLKGQAEEAQALLLDDLLFGVQVYERREDGTIRRIDPLSAEAREVLRVRDFDLARHPLKAWDTYGQDRPTLAYCSSVDQAKKWAKEFAEDGTGAAVVHGQTDPQARRRILESFVAGDIKVIWSVGVLTEGIDLPRTSCILLARPCELQRTYLQITGRALRTHPGKRDAILIDLVGATRVHGTPAEDRHYVLVGNDPIRRVEDTPLRQCFQCGKFIAAHLRICSECGYRFGAKGKRAPRIGNLELAAVYAGEETPRGDRRDAVKMPRVNTWTEPTTFDGWRRKCREQQQRIERLLATVARLRKLTAAQERELLGWRPLTDEQQAQNLADNLGILAPDSGETAATLGGESEAERG